MIQNQSAGQAKSYYSDALVQADYYMDSQEIGGHFQGKLADRLGLSGPVSHDVFFALCDNVYPETSKPLTPRYRHDRRVGYDVNFHCPKSVSILHALSKDTHILDAFTESVRDTMLEMEADTKTRVRKNGAYGERETGEMIWADFVHTTSRPVDQHAPDMHLHSHCFIFNMTYDASEKQVKAGEFRDIKTSMPYYQARFHKRLSDRLIKLGYRVERTGKSFEVAGVPKRVIELFSKRTDEIGRAAKEKNITDARELDGLGARTRSAKNKKMTLTELKADWRRQMRENIPEAELSPDLIIRSAPGKEAVKNDPQLAVDYALLHCFERASVVPYRKLEETAVRQCLGDLSVSVQDVEKAMQNDSRIIRIKERGREYCTTKEVLREEQEMVNLARKGKGQLLPMYSKAPSLKLDGQQAEAISHILTTNSRVSIVRGAAGTGKTSILQEAAKHIEAAGKKLTVVAPTAQASRGVLRADGFEQAETVATLLGKPKQQEQLKGGVLWVDEAGLLGTADMKAILELVEHYDAQLVLGGDTRQHSAVVRGDALRVLNTVAGIHTAEVSKIFRQKDELYRNAVEDLSQGNVRSGFDKLDEMDAIKTIDPLKPHDQLITDYIKAVKAGKSTLVISPTHDQGEAVTDALRERMRELKLIGKKEAQFLRLKNRNLTEAEKTDWRNYQPGQVVQFHQNLKGIRRGSRWKISQADNKGVFLENGENEAIPLPLEKSGKFDVYEAANIGLSKGDQVRITQNGFDAKDNRLDNGDLLKVVSVSKKGQVSLRKGKSFSTYTLDQDFGHITHAHCITSHGSQGKTVDAAFVMQPSATFSATDARQFYVSVSRAKERTLIYTDDKEALLEHAAEAGDRASALELVSGSKKAEHLEYVQQLQREQQPRSDVELTKSSPTIDLEDYEPR
ncbi:MAG: MobF family relaxase [Bacteroidota bacterium]